MTLSAKDLGFSDDRPNNLFHPPSSSQPLQTTSSPEFLRFDHPHRALHSHTILPPPPNIQSAGQHPQLATLSQTAEIAATTHGANRPPNVTNTITSLDLIKSRFLERQEIRKRFLDLMKELKDKPCVTFFPERVAPMIPWLKMNSIDTPGVIQRVAELFHGQSDLVEVLNPLLPPGYHIEISSDPRQEVMAVTTPMGVLTHMSDGSIRRLPQNTLSLQPPPVVTPSPSNLQPLSVNASDLCPITPQSVVPARIPPPLQLSTSAQASNVVAVPILGNTSGRSGRGPFKTLIKRSLITPYFSLQHSSLWAFD